MSSNKTKTMFGLGIVANVDWCAGGVARPRARDDLFVVVCPVVFSLPRHAAGACVRVGRRRGRRGGGGPAAPPPRPPRGRSAGGVLLGCPFFRWGGRRGGDIWGGPPHDRSAIADTLPHRARVRARATETRAARPPERPPPDVLFKPHRRFHLLSGGGAQGSATSGMRGFIPTGGFIPT